MVGFHFLRQTEVGAKIDCNMSTPLFEAQHVIMSFVQVRMGWPKPKIRLPASCQAPSS
jgi:hypothetical protein